MARGKTWTDEELAILREIYPKKGWRTVARRTGRKKRPIFTMASKLGIKGPEHSGRTKARVVVGSTLEQAMELFDQGVPITTIGPKLGMTEQATTNAIYCELAKRAGTAAKRNKQGRLTPEGRKMVHDAIERGDRGSDIQRTLGVTASQVTHERNRLNLQLAREGLPPLPPLGSGQVYSGRRVAEETKAKIRELLEQGATQRAAAQEVGHSRKAVRIIQTEIEGERAEQQRSAREQAEAEILEQAGGDEGLARQLRKLMGGASLVAAFRPSKAAPDFTLGGVTGAINT